MGAVSEKFNERMDGRRTNEQLNEWLWLHALDVIEFEFGREIASTAEQWLHARNVTTIDFFEWWKNIHAILKEKLFLRKHFYTLHFYDIVLHLHFFLPLTFLKVAR